MPRLAVYRLDVLMEINTGGPELQGILYFNATLFNQNTIKRMASHFTVLLSSLARQPQARLSELMFIDNEERQLVRSHSCCLISDACQHDRQAMVQQAAYLAVVRMFTCGLPSHSVVRHAHVLCLQASAIGAAKCWPHIPSTMHQSHCRGLGFKDIVGLGALKSEPCVIIRQLLQPSSLIKMSLRPTPLSSHVLPQAAVRTSACNVHS